MTNKSTADEEVESFRAKVHREIAKVKASKNDGPAITGQNGSIYFSSPTGTTGTYKVSSDWTLTPRVDLHGGCQPKADYEDLLEVLLALLLRDHDGELVLPDTMLDGILADWRLIKADVGDSAVRLVAVPAEVAIER